jgi:hypothetical protein
MPGQKYLIASEVVAFGPINLPPWNRLFMIRTGRELVLKKKNIFIELIPNAFG